MYLHRQYDARAVPRYLPVYNQVGYLDEQIDAIARGKHLARKRVDRQLEKATDGFQRIMKQSELLEEKLNWAKMGTRTDQRNYNKDLLTTAKTQADISDSQWRDRQFRRGVEEVRQFQADELLKSRLRESNINAFNRLQIIRNRN